MIPKLCPNALVFCKVSQVCFYKLISDGIQYSEIVTIKVKLFKETSSCEKLGAVPAINDLKSHTLKHLSEMISSYK